MNNFFHSSRVLRENSFSVFQLYKEVGKYHDAIILMEEFLLNPYSTQNPDITASTIGKDLIECYLETTKNVDEIIEKTIKLAEKIDKNKSESESNIINVQKDASYIRQCLIDYLYNTQRYSKCLELILELSGRYPNILESRQSSFSPFNKNIFYLAECYLRLNNLILAKKYYEQSIAALDEDVRFSATAFPLLIHPLPNYLKVNEKQDYMNKSRTGLKKIEILLLKDTNLTNFIFKTNVERSIGNISLLIKERVLHYGLSFDDISDDLINTTEDEKHYSKIIFACACAINGYVNEMFFIVDNPKIEKHYPIISTLLKLLFYYNENNFERFNELIIKLHKKMPESTIPLSLSLFFFRYKRGASRIYNIINLFKSIWLIKPQKLQISNVELQILNYLTSNLIWYPFKWAVNYEKYISLQKKEEKALLFKVLKFVGDYQINPEKELLELITRFLNPDRGLFDLLSLLLILDSYEFPETKYFIYKLLNPEIGQYELSTFGKLAYQSKKLDEFLPFLNDYIREKIELYKNAGRSDSNRIRLEERYVTFLLNCFNHSNIDDKIVTSLNYFKSISDYSQTKLKYFKALLALREKRYHDAEINAYQSVKGIIDNTELKWDDDFFKIWILSKILFNISKGKKLIPIEFVNEITEIINFEKIKKKPIHFQLVILGLLNHELLKNHEKDIQNFGKALFIESFNHMDWSDDNTHSEILEKIYFNRTLICKFPLEIINKLDELIDKLKPGKFNQVRKNYLYYIKAIIYFRNDRINQAKEVIELLFRIIHEEKIYTTYYDVNDLYLEIISKIKAI